MHFVNRYINLKRCPCKILNVRKMHIIVRNGHLKKLLRITENSTFPTISAS